MVWVRRDTWLFHSICGWVLANFLALSLIVPAAQATTKNDGQSLEVEDVKPIKPQIRSIRNTQRQRDMTTISRELERDAIRKRLKQIGFTTDEITQRLQRLSDEQIHRMAQRIESVKAGGHADFPEAPDHPVLLILFIILIPIIAVVWLIMTLFHTHPHSNQLFERADTVE